MDHPTPKVEMQSDDDDLSMKVRFTQEFTIKPPGDIQDEIAARGWLHNDPEMILRPGLDVQQGSIEVLEIND